MPSEKLTSWRRVCQVFDDPKIHRRHPGWKSVLDTCAVFDFTGHDYEELRGSVKLSENASELVSPLPFPTIAVVHDWQFFVVEMFWVSEDTNLIGANMLAFMCPYAEHKSQYEMIISGELEVDISVLPEGKKSPPATASDLRYTTVLEGKPTAINKETDELSPLGATDIDPNGGKALETLSGLFWNLVTFLTYINAPTRFIVKHTPKKMAAAKKGKIPRLYQRPQYIVLDKEKIRTRYLASQPSGRKSPMPHLRRGHYRTLTSDKFRKKGQRVWVRATHVKGNDVEWREGDRFYQVI